MPPPNVARGLAVKLLFAGLLALSWAWGHDLPRGGRSGEAGWGGTASTGAAPGEAATGLRMHEVAQASGLVFRHEPPRFDEVLDPIAPQIASLGAAVSVVDVDGDGDLDVYAVTSRHGRPNALWLNDGEGRFTESAAAAGLDDLNRDGEGCSMGSLWADVDNDGDQDVLVYKWGRSQLFENDGGLRFTDVTEAVGLGRWMHATAAVWFDADRDGRLDLYLGGYFREDVDLWDVDDTRIMHESFEFARNGGHNVLFRQRADGTFEDVTAQAGVDSTRWTMAVASADFDGNGFPDLYLANDYGPEELFLNVDGRRFEAVTDAGLDGQSKSGMCVALGDVTNEGRLAVFVTNISERRYLFQGNNLRLNDLADSGLMLDVARGPELDCGWAWGAQFGDLDNDGWQDLFVVNGFVSANPDKSYWYDMTKLGGGLGRLFEDAANWPPFEDKSLSGYQRSSVLLGREGRFVDVAEQVGVTDLDDGRAVVLADLFGDGTLDAVVANQDGPLLLYRSDPIPSRRWIAFDLTGTVSNRDAIGAEVLVHREGRVQRQVVTAGVGFASQAPRRLHFGLGETGALERVVVRWPSGAEQELIDLELDVVHALTEPR